MVWLYHKYKCTTPNENPLKAAQHTLPTTILDSLITTFNISHSYYSSLVTCSTQPTQFYFPFARDKIFGSLSPALQYKWKGIDLAHPHILEIAQQAMHWARLSAQKDPTTTILVVPDTNWYHNYNPYTGPFPDTHVITHFAADTITYEEPTLSPESKQPWTEPLAI